MKKQTIKLNESQLRGLINESIKSILNENTFEGSRWMEIIEEIHRLATELKELANAEDTPMTSGKLDLLEAAQSILKITSSFGGNMDLSSMMNESQLRQMIKEALNEIGDTLNGQEALGALHAKKVYNNSRINYKKTGELAHNPTSDEKEIYDYAKKKRGDNNDMETAYANGYIKQRDKENSKGINESKVNKIIKESIKKVLKENHNNYVWFYTEEWDEGGQNNVHAYGCISWKEANEIERDMNRFSPYDYAVAQECETEEQYNRQLQARKKNGAIIKQY